MLTMCEIRVHVLRNQPATEERLTRNTIEPGSLAEYRNRRKDQVSTSALFEPDSNWNPIRPRYIVSEPN